MEAMRTAELNNDEPGERQVLLNMIYGEPDTNPRGRIQVVTVRLPRVLHYTLKAISEASPSGASMNAIMEQMLRVGVEQLEAEMPSEFYRKVDLIRERLIAEDAVK